MVVLVVGGRWKRREEMAIMGRKRLHAVIHVVINTVILAAILLFIAGKEVISAG